VLDVRFAHQQLVERAIPLLELAHLDPHPRRPTGEALPIIAPRRNKTAAIAIADKIGLQPARQSVLAARCGQPIGDQHQGAIAQRRSVTTAALHEPVKRRLKGEFAPDMARCQHRAPVPRRNRLHVRTPNLIVGYGITV
jgi:hypothetical protein